MQTAVLLCLRSGDGGMLSYRINEASGRLLLTAVIYAVMDTDYKYIVVVEFPELFS